MKTEIRVLTALPTQRMSCHPDLKKSSSWYLLWSNLDMLGSHQEKFLGFPQRYSRKRFVTSDITRMLMVGDFGYPKPQTAPTKNNQYVPKKNKCRELQYLLHGYYRQISVHLIHLITSTSPTSPLTNPGLMRGRKESPGSAKTPPVSDLQGPTSLSVYNMVYEKT